MLIECPTPSFDRGPDVEPRIHDNHSVVSTYVAVVATEHGKLAPYALVLLMYGVCEIRWLFNTAEEYEVALSLIRQYV